jgi:hypothetical protein
MTGEILVQNSSKKKSVLFFVCAMLCLWHTPAEAARRFSVTQLTTPAEFPMGAAQSLTFTVGNTSTGSNSSETITRVQFNVSGNYSYFPPQTIAVTGWTCSLSRSSGGNYRRITCSANTWGDRIAAGNSQNFTFKIINRTTLTTDRNDALSSVVASFLSGRRTRTVSNNNQGQWTWKSLLMTLVPSSTTVGNNCQFTLTMTVTNKTSGTLNNITSVPSARPTASTTSANVNNPPATPASLNLTAGTTGTITWTYTLTDTGAPGGSVYFTACASTNNSCSTNSGTSRTSATVSSVSVTINSSLVCGFTISSFTNNPVCLYSGDIATFVMTVSNTTGATLNNVVPSAIVSVITGSAAIGSFTPTTQPPISIPNGATGTFTWTAPVTGDPNATYAVQGYATNGVLSTATATSTVQDVDGYNVSAGTTNADSSDAEITWTIENWACSNINQVSISIPGGWTFEDDGYALVTNLALVDDDFWTRPAGSTTFTAQAAADRVPSGGNTGSYFLLFSQTPLVPGDYIFNVTITDDLGVVRVKPSTVTVNPFNTSGLNDTNTGIWHEDVQ